MHTPPPNVRAPVRRLDAELYLLITLLSFASSVSLTRLFLELTGYPQLGGGEYHIAHVLWGGLALFAASVLPLVLANRWAYSISAALSGVGVGLFIDEVGKFITSSNDYFHPLAAPIVYAFFLLTVMVYLQVRRPADRNPRAELYRVLNALEEALDHDLDHDERLRLLERIARIKTITADPALILLAKALEGYLSSLDDHIKPVQTTLLSRQLARLRLIEARWLTAGRLRAALAGGLAALGVMALVSVAVSTPMGPMRALLENSLVRLINEGQIRGAGSLSLFAARLALETSVGLLLVVSAGLLAFNRVRLGLGLGYLGLLLALTTVNLLVFFFDQFSTILTASLQFTALLGIIYYRRRWLPPEPPVLHTAGAPAAAEPQPLEPINPYQE